ncbi:MAG TPA: hypothetical protein VF210_17510 [Pseudomonadales bacterium]
MISHVRVAAAHDGEAELVVTLTHGNGGTSQVTLDEIAARALLESCNASRADDLLGHGWDKVRDALAVSWNRFSNLRPYSN